MPAPALYIIAGPNGVGKTTFADRYLPDEIKQLEFVNVDMIAHGLSPYEARLLVDLERVNQRIAAAVASDQNAAALNERPNQIKEQ